MISILDLARFLSLNEMFKLSMQCIATQHILKEDDHLQSREVELNKKNYPTPLDKALRRKMPDFFMNVLVC
jgi:hypothetical protein